MSTKKHADKGQPYVRLFTAALVDEDLLDAGDVGWVLATKMLLWSAFSGTAGLVPADPRKVQRFCHLEDGVPACAAGIDALVASRFLVDSDEDGYYLIRSYARFQSDLGGSSTRSETSTKSALVRWHNKGSHAPAAKGKQPGCPLCDAGKPSVDHSGTDEPSVAPKSVSDVLDASSVRSKVWAKLDDQLAADAKTGVDPLQTYLDLAEYIVDVAPKFADVPRITETVLVNLVVSHAIQNLWSNGTKLAQDVERQVHGLRKTHGTPATIAAVVKAAAADKPAAYCAGILKNGAAA